MEGHGNFYLLFRLPHVGFFKLQNNKIRFELELVSVKWGGASRTAHSIRISLTKSEPCSIQEAGFGDVDMKTIKHTALTSKDIRDSLSCSQIRVATAQEYILGYPKFHLPAW